MRPRASRFPPAVTRTRPFVDRPGPFLALVRGLSCSPLICRRWPCADVSSLPTVDAAVRFCRSGSSTAPVTHNLCRKTASFRATATTALRVACLPPRAAHFMPCRRKAPSSPNGPRRSWALPTSRRRSMTSPVFVIPSCGERSPASSCCGTRPTEGPPSRLLVNRAGSSLGKSKALAVNAPTPWTGCHNAAFGD
jgi:hypothetical protein